LPTSRSSTRRSSRSSSPTQGASIKFRLRDGGRYHVRWHEVCGHHIRPH
jgi:hypothetical protein